MLRGARPAGQPGRVAAARKWPEASRLSDAAELSDDQLLEKLEGFGLEVDQAERERPCEGALSVEDVAHPLIDRCGAEPREGRPHEDWIWLWLLELWRRWWPEGVRRVPGR